MYLDGPNLPPPRPSLQLSGLPGGVAGAKFTLRVMSQLLQKFKRDQRIRQLALQLVADCAPKDRMCEIAKIHAFVRDRIRYVRDTYGVETVHEPVATLEIGQGDCDDKALLAATLLASIGYPTQFIAVGFKPGTLSHVYTAAWYQARGFPGAWIPLETTEPVKVGWHVPNARTQYVVENRT